MDVLGQMGRYDKWVPLLLRIGVGLTMFFAGYAKVTGGMAGLAKFFGSSGIPMAGVMAPLIAYLEMLGGIAILLGLVTRLVGLLFAADMAVAIIMVRWALVTKGGAFDFSQMRTEWLLLLGGLALLLLGPGPLAVDRMLNKAQPPARKMA